MKRIIVYTLLFSLLLSCALFLHTMGRDGSFFSAYAEIEEQYTSFEEFLPVVEKEEQEGEVVDVEYLEQNGYITGAKIKGIKIRKDENTILFLLSPESGVDLGEKQLFYEVLSVGFPPRIIVRRHRTSHPDVGHDVSS